ncbi:MAG: GTPase Era [Mycoplasmataceae bacterium]|nr:GTPase Era [Mycoplasmataceae bacterium]
MRNGYVSITGKPNVGKSTLINAFLKYHVAITSPKPQTTRNQIRAIYQTADCKIAFIDTPGWHEPKFKLDLFLNSEIKNSYKVADVILLLIDLTRLIDDEDRKVIETINKFNLTNVILVLTKKDISSPKKINEYTQQLAKMINPLDTIAISSKKNLSLDQLIKTISLHLPIEEQTLMVEENDNKTISEIIRQQVIFNTRQELPYASTVVIELNNYDEFTNTLNVQATIVVEKESQKPILIGKNGSMIKKIGIMARKDLMNIYSSKINLKLFVKVEKDWRNNEKFLKDIGYSNK